MNSSPLCRLRWQPSSKPQSKTCLSTSLAASCCSSQKGSKRCVHSRGRTTALCYVKRSALLNRSMLTPPPPVRALLTPSSLTLCGEAVWVLFQLLGMRNCVSDDTLFADISTHPYTSSSLPSKANLASIPSRGGAPLRFLISANLEVACHIQNLHNMF